MKTTPSSPSLELEAISTGYETKVVSQNISLSLPEGKLVALLGPNGSGKSTLLKAIAFGDTLLAGEISVAGQALSGLSYAQRARVVSIVLSQAPVELRMSVEEVVAIGRSPYLNAMGRLDQQDKKIIDQALRLCQLEGYEKRKIHTLSDGERQRVMIARAIAQDTPLIILDEPTAHLDIIHRVSLFSLLRDLTHSIRRTIVLSTHELHLAVQWADTLWLINRMGELSHGIPESLAMSGQLGGLFESKDFRFDPTTGRVEMCHPGSLPIYVQPDMPAETALWLHRMLVRLGYRPIHTAQKEQISYKGDAHSFVWQNGEQIKIFSSLEDLASFLSAR